MTLTLNALGCLAIAVVTVLKRISVARPWIGLGRRAGSLRRSSGGRREAPSARHRDDMIRYGLMS
jgi:hypothetical protein